MRARIASRLGVARAEWALRRARSAGAVAPKTPGARGTTSAAAAAWVVGELSWAIDVAVEVLEMEIVIILKCVVPKYIFATEVRAYVARRRDATTRNAFLEAMELFEMFYAVQLLYNLNSRRRHVSEVSYLSFTKFFDELDMIFSG